MFTRQILYRSFVMATFVFALSASALADTIKLKDGSTVKGRITAFGDGKFTIAIGEGTRRREIVFDASEVESITFDRSGEVEIAKEASKNAVLKSNEPEIEPPAKVESLPVKVETVKTSTSASPIKPIVINVNVLADNTANGWTNSGWVVKKGQRIRIRGEGEVSLGRGQKSGPSGSSALEDAGKLLKSVPTGALIAVIGDDNNDFIYVGADREFVAARDGTLFLGVNEGNLNDNTGSFKVKVEISPDSGS